MKAPWSKDAPRTGRFQRKQSEFRHAITRDGPYTPEAGRYHLYVQYACPWAHRTLLARKLLGLEEAVSVSVVSWRMQDDGSWIFEPELDGCTPDHLHDARSMQDVYRRADPAFAGIGTVPVLWDKQTDTIVNNESREILRMFVDVLGPAVGNGRLQSDLTPEVDAMIDANYETVNNGVYKCGFARSQEAYDEAWPALFDRLDALEAHMEGRDWLVGEGRGQFTEADICLWPTLLRFDPVYHTHFKCNRRLISQMPNLWAYVKRLHDVPGVADTIDMEHIRNHYYWSHTSLNPHRIVPVGPALDL